MKLDKIREVHKSRFIRRYDLEYTMKNGQPKRYEMVSRFPVKTAAQLADSPSDGVVLIVMSRDKSRVLLNKEFRPAVAKPVYNFPAGLIDPGETPAEAARRELWEETGLEMLEELAFWDRSYGAVGISNESALIFICTADETRPFGGNHSPEEEIEPVWVSREEAAAIVQGCDVTARVQMFLGLWAGLAGI